MFYYMAVGGSGKSSLIKSLLHEYSDRGLRLIEVAKSDLKDLPLVVEQLRGGSRRNLLFLSMIYPLKKMTMLLNL